MPPFVIHAEVHTPVGVFTGYASADIANEEDAKTERDEIEAMLQPSNTTCETFTFFSDKEGEENTDITICRDTVLNSVFKLTVKTA